MEFAQEPNILHAKVWQTSWATRHMPLRSIPTWPSQSRKYCTCGFVAVLGNILNRPRYRKNLEVWHMPCAIQTENKRISQSHPWLSNEFKASLDYQNTNKPKTNTSIAQHSEGWSRKTAMSKVTVRPCFNAPTSKYKTDTNIWKQTP